VLREYSRVGTVGPVPSPKSTQGKEVKKYFDSHMMMALRATIQNGEKLLGGVECSVERGEYSRGVSGRVKLRGKETVTGGQTSTGREEGTAVKSSWGQTN